MPKARSNTETRSNRVFVGIPSPFNPKAPEPPAPLTRKESPLAAADLRRTPSGRQTQVYVDIVSPFSRSRVAAPKVAGSVASSLRKSAFVDIVSPFKKATSMRAVDASTKSAPSERSESSALSRQNSAYVEIVSPFKKATPVVDADADARPSAMQGNSRKRALSDSRATENCQDTGAAPKRVKASADSRPQPPVSAGPQADRNEESSHGSSRCHQCGSKDVEYHLHCTFIVKENRCRKKYCGRCLKTRYGLSMIAIQSDDTQSTGGHTITAGYVFKCPACSGTCNCSQCRKKQGLEPTGKMKTADLEKLAQEAAAQERASASSNQPRPRAKKAPPPKPIQAPVVRWTPLPVPAAFTYEQAEARIQIREFCVRFYDDIHLEKTMIEELELVDGDAIEEDAINNDDGAVSVTWVGEECVRELMAHLLDVMATDEDDLPRRRLIMDAAKAIRSSGANLGAMWSALKTMRNSCDSDEVDFPDPSPAPSASARKSRKVNTKGPSVFFTAQLIPVVAGLIDLVCVTRTMREAFDYTDAYLSELKEDGNKAVQRVQGLVRAEKEKGIKASKNVNAARKETLSDLKHARMILTSGIRRRAGPLGTDKDGRVYWALSPGMAERELAMELLSDGNVRRPTRGKNASPPTFRRLAALTEEERAKMARWSWFIAVWGRRPDDPRVVLGDEKDDDDVDCETWWCFWRPEDIADLAGWLAFTHDTDNASDHEDEDGAQAGSRNESPYAGLVKGVRDFGELLAWRAKRATATPSTVSTGNGRRGALAPVAFYQ